MFSARKPALVSTAVLALALSACSGGGDDQKTPDSGAPTPSEVKSASKSANSPDLNKASINVDPDEQISGREVKVPGPNGSVLTITTTPVTTGTLSSVRAEDGKAYSAPTGKGLAAVSIVASQEGPTDSDSKTGLARYDKPISVSVKAGAEESKITDLKASDLNGGDMTSTKSGKHWIVQVPQQGKGAKLVLATDGGEQIVDLTSGKRDDQNSNGLALDSKVTVPVASSSDCEDAAKPTGTNGGTADDPFGCSVSWSLVDHVEGAGWAPKGKTFLVADIDPTLPGMTVDGDEEYEQQTYGTPRNATISGTMGKEKSSRSHVENTDWNVRNAQLVFPISESTKPKKIDFTMKWKATSGYVSDGFPQSVQATAKGTISGVDTTETLTVGDVNDY